MQIAHQISPKTEEKIIDKFYSSSFKETNLKAYLDEKQFSKLVIMGMQTEYCVDTAIRVAFELGYNLIVPQDLNTTFDTKNIIAENIRIKDQSIIS